MGVFFPLTIRQALTLSTRSTRSSGRFLRRFWQRALAEGVSLVLQNAVRASSGPPTLERLVANNHNSNTAASTKNWLRRFQKWAAEKGVASDIATIPREELDQVLQHFYAELIKKDGQEYEPESLKVMIAALDRHVREKCGSSILKGKDFEQSRLVLNGRAIELQKRGKGKKPRKAHALTEEEEQVLWRMVLGQETRRALTTLSSFFLDNTLAHVDGRNTIRSRLRTSNRSETQQES